MGTLTAIHPIIAQLKLQTRLFNNVIDGIKIETGASKLSDTTNPLVWIAGHIVSTRYQLAYVLGIPIKEPFPKLFEKGKKFDSAATYPPWDEIGKGWGEVSSALAERLENMPEHELSYEGPIQTPIGDNSMMGFITFFMHHEAYHIGQLGISRRYFGYAPMKYG